MTKNKIIQVKGIPVATFNVGNEDFISFEFLGLWEQLNNPNFKGVEFDSFMYQSGSNAFTLSPSKWIEVTNATGLVSKQGNNGGTFAHN